VTRVVFFGTPAFAVPSLSALIASGANIAAVVTQPDRPRTRSHSTLLPSPVKVRALEAQLTILQPERPRGEEFLNAFRALNADIGVVVAYGHLLPPELLAIPRVGCVNVHASLLPRWRGAAPIQWALLSGDPETGVTIMRVEKGLDTGAVWHERDTAISEADTAATLTERLSELGAEALMEVLPRILLGAEPRPQDSVGATHAPKIDRATARIRWNESAHAVSCRIRAMDPAPGAWTTVAGVELKVYGARAGGWGPRAAPPRALSLGPLVEQPLAPSPQPPGTIIRANNAMHVTTSDGTVEISAIQPAGRRRMPASEWLRGANLPADARFA
jgi:methionyl-tRNA formyltransferase